MGTSKQPLYNIVDGKCTSVGHGCWAYSVNGYTWSHSVSAENHKSIEKPSITGDVIVMKYENRTLTFSKSNSLITTLSNVDDDTVPFVSLGTADDSVEIVSAILCVNLSVRKSPMVGFSIYIGILTMLPISTSYSESRPLFIISLVRLPTITQYCINKESRSRTF